MTELLNADAGPARWMECWKKVTGAWRRNRGSRLSNPIREQEITQEISYDITLGRSTWSGDAMPAEGLFRRSIAFRPSRRNGQPLHFVVRFSKTVR